MIQILALTRVTTRTLSLLARTTLETKRKVMVCSRAIMKFTKIRLGPRDSRREIASKPNIKRICKSLREITDPSTNYQ